MREVEVVMTLRSGKEIDKPNPPPNYEEEGDDSTTTKRRYQVMKRVVLNFPRTTKGSPKSSS